MFNAWEALPIETVTYEFCCWYCRATDRQTFESTWIVGISALPWPQRPDGWHNINGRAVCPKHTRFAFVADATMPIDMTEDPVPANAGDAT